MDVFNFLNTLKQIKKSDHINIYRKKEFWLSLEDKNNLVISQVYLCIFLLETNQYLFYTITANEQKMGSFFQCFKISLKLFENVTLKFIYLKSGISFFNALVKFSICTE